MLFSGCGYLDITAGRQLLSIFYDNEILKARDDFTILKYALETIGRDDLNKAIDQYFRTGKKWNAYNIHTRESKPRYFQDKSIGGKRLVNRHNLIM